MVSTVGLKHSALRFLERTADFSEVEKFEGKGLSCMPKIDYKVQMNTKNTGRGSEITIARKFLTRIPTRSTRSGC